MVREGRFRDGCLDRAARLLLALGERTDYLEPDGVAQRMQHVGQADLFDVWMMQASHVRSVPKNRT